MHAVGLSDDVTMAGGICTRYLTPVVQYRAGMSSQALIELHVLLMLQLLCPRDAQ